MTVDVACAVDWSPSSWQTLPLKVKNTFIDVDASAFGLPEIPSAVTRFTSCPATISQAAQPLAIGRFQGSSLEVHLPGRLRVADVRSRTASILGVTPSCVNVTGSNGRNSADSALIPDYDNVEIVVLDEEASKRHSFERGLTSLLNRTNLRNAKDLPARLSHLAIAGQGEMSMVIHAVIERAVGDIHACEAIADALVALKESHPGIPAVDRADGAGVFVKFKRLLLDVCQEVHEEMIGNRNQCSSESRSARLALAVFFGHLFNRDMLHEKVIRQIIDDLIGGEFVRDPVSIECACSLLELMRQAYNASSQRHDQLLALLSDIEKRLAAIEEKAAKACSSSADSSATTTIPLRVRFRVQGVLDVHGKGLQRSRI